MHNEFGRSSGSSTNKRDGFSVASNATATTRSTCSSQESSRSSSRLKGTSSSASGSKSVSSSSSSRRRAAGPPRTTSSREGLSSRSSSRDGGSSACSNKSSSAAAGAADFGSSFGSDVFGSTAFADFSEPFGSSSMQTSNFAAPAPASAAAAAAPKQRARRRASVVGGGTTPTATLPAAADPAVAAAEPQTRRRSPPERQRSRSGERSTASSSGDSRRAGGRRTATRRASNGAADGGGSGLSRAKSTGDFLDFDANNNSRSDGLDMFGGAFGGGSSPTGAADYGYGDDATQATADYGYGDHQTVSEGMDYDNGNGEERPRVKLSRARRSSIGVTQFGGSSDAFINNLCQTNTLDLMSEKDVEKPKPKPCAAGGPSMIAMPLAGESPAGAKIGIGGAGGARRVGRRASLMGGMNVGVCLVTNKLASQAGEKLDDPDSARKNKASFFKDRSGGGDHKVKGAPSAATRSKSASDSISSYNPDRDRRQMMKD
jgi:hypothetical protein